MQYSEAVINARLDAGDEAIGAGARLHIRSGPLPLDCAAPDRGAVLVDGALPEEWSAPAERGTKDKIGDWSWDAVATGKPGHFRIRDASGRCHIQGTCGPHLADLLLDERGLIEGAIVKGSRVSVVRFRRVGGNR